MQHSQEEEDGLRWKWYIWFVWWFWFPSFLLIMSWLIRCIYLVLFCWTRSLKKKHPNWMSIPFKVQFGVHVLLATECMFSVVCHLMDSEDVCARAFMLKIWGRQHRMFAKRWNPQVQLEISVLFSAVVLKWKHMIWMFSCSDPVSASLMRGNMTLHYCYKNNSFLTTVSDFLLIHFNVCIVSFFIPDISNPLEQREELWVIVTDSCISCLAF